MELTAVSFFYAQFMMIFRLFRFAVELEEKLKVLGNVTQAGSLCFIQH